MMDWAVIEMEGGDIRVTIQDSSREAQSYALRKLKLTGDILIMDDELMLEELGSGRIVKAGSYGVRVAPAIIASGQGTEYKLLSGVESFGGDGVFGLRVLAHLGRPITHEDVSAVYTPLQQLENGLRLAIIKADPKAQAGREKNILDIRGIFGDRMIFAEELPQHGYWGNDPYGWRTPWQQITTAIGRFRIGWRKRVISIEWKDTLCKQSAETLFPGENVTKDGQLIHAWSYEDAKRYVNTIHAAMEQKNDAKNS